MYYTFCPVKIVKIYKLSRSLRLPEPCMYETIRIICTFQEDFIHFLFKNDNKMMSMNQMQKCILLLRILQRLMWILPDSAPKQRRSNPRDQWERLVVAGRCAAVHLVTLCFRDAISENKNHLIFKVFFSKEVGGAFLKTNLLSSV